MSLSNRADELNSEQRAAVEHERGPLLVLAGAGSGKTRVIAYRLAGLIARGADPRHIVALTFTNKAAGEMRERVADLTGRAPAGFIGTFHAWGLRFLRRHAQAAGIPPGFSIADSGEQVAFIRAALAEAGLSEQTFPPNSVHARISEAKGALISPERFGGMNDDFSGSRIARVFALYEKRLHKSGAVDFDDLLVLPVAALGADAGLKATVEEEVEHLLIDEYQDTNVAQDALVKLLAGRAASLCAVGDEDQSIYGWRGARIDHILRFEEDFPGAAVVTLTRNYRSTREILAAASALVSVNRRRREKKLVSDARGEPVDVRVFSDDRREAEWVAARVASSGRPASDLAVLFRVNAQSRAFEDEFVQRRIPYVVVGGWKFYERAEVKDALAYLRLAADPGDDLAFRRVVNVPARGIGGATMDRLTEFAAGKGMSLFAASADVDGVTQRACIALARFRELIGGLAGAVPETSIADLLDRALKESGYAGLAAALSDPDEAARRENLKELVSAAQEFERREGPAATLRGFLDTAALATDTAPAGGNGAVSLLTLHSAKGLEFSEVVIAGIEEGFLPHAQSSGDAAEIEEERRLLYVGMTRAGTKLTLTAVRERMIFGERRSREPSRFLEDLPDSVVRHDDPIAPRPAEAGGRLFAESPSSFRANRPAISVPRRRAALPGSVPGLARGQRVRHERYGQGVVVGQEGSGEDARLTVYFDRVGRKKFVAKFANLVPLGPGV